MINKEKLTISALAILACFLWSTAFVTIKIGLKYIGPLSFAGIRFIIAGLILLPFCGNIMTFIKSVKANLKTVMLVSLFQTIILYGIFNTAMTMVSGATGAILIGSSPFVTAIVAHILIHDDKITRSKMISIILGICGIVILTLSKHSLGNKGSSEIFGIILLLIGSVSSALGNIVVSKKKKDINAFHLTSSQIFIGGVVLLLISLPFEGLPQLVQPLPFYLSLTWLSVVSAAGFSLWFMLLHKPGVKVSELNIWKFIIPVCGAVLSWIFLPESPTLMAILGMIFIVGSILSANIYFLKKVKQNV